VAVLVGGDERLDHLGRGVVAAEMIELREPVVVAVQFASRPSFGLRWR
jgi:hypothetical protein